MEFKCNKMYDGIGTVGTQGRRPKSLGVEKSLDETKKENFRKVPSQTEK